MNIKTEKPKFLNTKTGKTDLKNGLNCKTENPNAPLLKTWLYRSAPKTAVCS